MGLSNTFKDQVEKNLVQGNPLFGLAPADPARGNSMEFSTPDKDDGGDASN